MMTKQSALHYICTLTLVTLETKTLHVGSKYLKVRNLRVRKQHPRNLPGLLSKASSVAHHYSVQLVTSSTHHLQPKVIESKNWPFVSFLILNIFQFATPSVRF